MAVWVKYPGFALYIGKKGHEMKRKQWGENSSTGSFTNKQSPQGGALSRDSLAQESKSPLFPVDVCVCVGGGGGGVRGYNYN